MSGRGSVHKHEAAQQEKLYQQHSFKLQRSFCSYYFDLETNSLSQESRLGQLQMVPADPVSSLTPRRRQIIDEKSVCLSAETLVENELIHDNCISADPLRQEK